MAYCCTSSIVCSGNAFTGNVGTLCISNEGCVCCFGKQFQGSNTQEYNTIIYPPQKIPSLKNITSIDCGYCHTLCLDIDGYVYSFGENKYSQLGLGKDVETLKFSNVPQQIIDIPPIKQISCGRHFSFCLSEDGFLYSFGENSNGQLGHGNNEKCNYPKKLDSLENVDFVRCGGDFVFCKIINNDLYSWGKNDVGQIGINNTIDQTLPIKSVDWEEDIVDLKCGFFHTLVLTSNQNVYSCGDCASLQLGRIITDRFSPSFQIIPFLSEIKRIECGYIHSMCIDNYDRLYVFGSNYFGQLGLQSYGNKGEPTLFPLSNIIDVSTKGFSSFIKTSKNEIYAFGNNKSLQLGIKTEKENQIKPIQILKDEEDIWCSNIRKSKAKSARK